MLGEAVAACAEAAVLRGAEVFVIGGDVLINGVLQSLALLKNAVLHLAAQLVVDLEVLHLELHIALLLRVNELGQH